MLKCVAEFHKPRWEWLLVGRPVSLWELCLFLTRPRPGHGQIRADSFSWADKQTDGRACQTQLVARARGKPCLVRLKCFSVEQSGLSTAKTSLSDSDTHDQIHTEIQFTDCCKILNCWLRNAKSICVLMTHIGKMCSMKVWTSTVPWQLSKFNPLMRSVSKAPE